MPSTDSFTSTASAVTSVTAVALTDISVRTDSPDVAVEYTRRGFRVAMYKNQVHITKASSFGGSQSALSLPLSLDDARDLAPVLRKLST